MHYQPKLKWLLAVASILVLVCSVSSTVDYNQASSSKQHDVVNPSSDEFQFGPFLMNRTYYQRNYSDRLKLSKTHVRYQFKLPFMSESSFLESKVKIREHMLRCDNLTLMDTALNSKLDCQPIEGYLSNHIDSGALPLPPSTATTNNAEYVKRTTIEVKWKLIGDIQLKYECILYPLKNQHTELKIGSILQENNLTSPLNFATPINLGYQLEINYFIGSKAEKYLTISGQLYLSVNASKPLPSDRDPNETYPEIMKKYEDFLGEAIDNGYLFSLRNLSCYQPSGPMNFVRIGTNFDVIHKNKFPFLTLTHSSWLEPLRSVFEYKAVINQTKTSANSDDTNLSYNTTIRIHSSSAVSKMLNINLEQTNENSPSGKFSEEMVAWSRCFIMRIAALKNETVFHKLAKLYLFDLDSLKDSLQKTHEVTKSAFLVFNDFKDEEGPTLCLNIRRDHANSLLGYPLNPFSSDVDPEESNEDTENLIYHLDL